MKKIILSIAFLGCFFYSFAQDHFISVVNTEFIPRDLVIRVGETVEWDNTEGIHNVNGSLATYPGNPEGFFSGAAVMAPWMFTHTFTQTGFYNYQCDPHVDFDMFGTVTVLPQVCTIGSITANDADGVPDSLGVNCEIQGIVYGVNYRPGGLQFTIIDSNNDGIGIFSLNNDFGYTVQEGDEVVVRGEVAFFNGLTQMNADTAYLVSSGNALFVPTVVTALGEDTESQLVTIENVSLVDPAQWTGSGSGFNVDVTDGVNTYTVRIDADVDIYSMGAPTGIFSVTGIGGQFDSSAPHDSGYQLLPRYAADIDPYIIDMPDFPVYDIGTITTLDTNGTPDSLSVACQIQGVVYGVNMRGSGLQFTIIDEFNDGIGVFSSSEDFGYTVQEGDEIILQGEVTFFNGFTQFAPSSLEFVDAGNALFDPTVVTALGEDTESQLVTIENVSVVDPAQWTGSGSGFNVDVTDGVNTYLVRIDADVDIYNMGVPLGTFNVTGLGGQFDNSEPYDEGYQLLPRYAADIDPYETEMGDFPAYPIGTISTVDANGNPDSLGVACQIQGVVYGVNMRGSGLQFTIIDEFNDGIGVFSSSEDFGYTVQEGDEIILQGEVTFFNGFTQFAPSSLEFVDAGNALFDPTVVTALGEDTESQLVTIENVSVVDPAQWTGSGSGFNVDVTDGVNTYLVRIDADVDIYNMGVPLGTFNVTGLGGQFDNSEPYDEGYQLLPRYAADIDPYEVEMMDFPAYPIGTISTVDADGNADSLGVACQIQGVVYGVNMRGSGLQFTIIDEFNDGIGVFSSSEDFGYTVQEGDEIILQGEVTFFNGLTQFEPSSLEFVDADNALFDPTIVTALGEDTESQLVTIENVSLVDPDQWSTSGSFNVDVTDGVNTYVVRIDSDVDISGMGAPIGTFDVTGLGGQFDNESPYFDGYQLLPRYVADIDPYETEEVVYPVYTIGEISTNDANGNPDSLGVACEITGVVYGVNLRLSGGGLQFTLIDDNNDGIHIFSNSSDLGYTVQEGDELRIQGEVAFFSGLTEFVPNNIEVISSGNALFDPTVVATLGEDTESQLVRLNGFSLVDPGQWTNSGGGFNVDASDGVNMIQIRIDADTDVFGIDPPTGTFDIIGLGGQFDSSEPYDEGYQLFPRYMPDIMEVSSVRPPVIPADISIFPNPTRAKVQVNTLEGLDFIRVSNILGQQMMDVQGPADNFELDMEHWMNGVYILTLFRDGAQWSTWVVKE